MEALMIAREYYNTDMAGYSIPAAEHSTITSWGRDHEVDAYRNMLEKYPTGLMATVSDSYDVFNACENLWGKTLKKEVLIRDGILIVRPDSGNPPEVVVEVLRLLGNAFGVQVNRKGYKVLNSKVRVIQGDGIDYEMLETILHAMEDEKWSADNIAFGSGGGLLQKVNRDTQKFAFKCSAACINGNWTDVMKDPITDQGKKSKAGRLFLEYNEKSKTPWKTIKIEDASASEPNQLKTVFLDGEIISSYTLGEIRERTNT